MFVSATFKSNQINYQSCRSHPLRSKLAWAGLTELFSLYVQSDRSICVSCNHHEPLATNAGQAVTVVDSTVTVYFSSVVLAISVAVGNKSPQSRGPRAENLALSSSESTLAKVKEVIGLCGWRLAAGSVVASARKNWELVELSF